MPPDFDGLRDAYLRIAKRAIAAGRSSLSVGVQEKAVFLLYHALESSGGALASSRSQEYAWRHDAKLNQMCAIAQGPLRHSAVRLCTLLGSLRNRCLYPEDTGVQVRRPENIVTAVEARELMRRVAGFVSALSAAVR